MRQLVVDIPAEIDRFVTHIRPDEYRILLTYAGQEVYEFFARDHRFGAPPRGKVYRSNKRKTWTTERSGVRRPDMAVVALERKIRYVEALGGDTDLLKIELQRRKDAIARGEDPMAGQRRHTLKKVQAPTPRQALDLMRASVFGRPTERKNFGRRWDD